METVYYGGPDEEDGTGISFYKRLRKFCIDIYGWTFFALVVLSPVIFFALCLIWWFRPIAFLYFCWIYYDGENRFNGYHRLSCMRKLIVWEVTRNYFPIKLVKTAELPADKRYLIASFPHGIFCIGMSHNILTDVNDFKKAYPGLKPYAAALNLLYYLPILGDFLSLLGCCGVSAAHVTHILNGEPGTVCVITVGGVAEAFQSFPGTNKIFLRNRKGFIRIALITGASLVPMFSFGETNIYYQPRSKLYKMVQSKIRSTTKIPIGVINGRGFFQDLIGILPYRRPITTVVGEPIDVPQIKNPTEEVVDKYHKQFIAALEGLFNRYKGKYDENGEKSELEIM